MAKVRSKGTVLKQDIAATLTAVAQIISIDLDGAESETYDATTLDTADAWKEYEPTGYSEPGSLSYDIFYDPGLSGHQAITDMQVTPAITPHEITYADNGTSPSTQAFNVAGVSFGATIAQDDGVRASITLKITGDPGYPT